jgi:hypothetical protein
LSSETNSTHLTNPWRMAKRDTKLVVTNQGAERHSSRYG